jgi:hypothetical protein
MGAARDISPTSLAVATGSLLLVLYLLYSMALPRPIPGIPYNQDAANRVLGDLPGMMAYKNRTYSQRRWFRAQAIKHRSPICQVFTRPFGKPTVVLADFRETQDILLRRGKDFDRSDRSADAFAGLIPDHMVSLKTSDPAFKVHRELLRDLVTPSYLNNVCGHDNASFDADPLGLRSRNKVKSSNFDRFVDGEGYNCRWTPV